MNIALYSHKGETEKHKICQKTLRPRFDSPFLLTVSPQYDIQHPESKDLQNIHRPLLAEIRKKHINAAVYRLDSAMQIC